MVGSKERYEICMEAASIALAAGDRGDAEQALRGAIQAIEGQNDFDPDLSATLIRLGSLKQEAGSYPEAEALFRRALEVAERAFGAHDQALVPALTGVGATRIMQGEPAEAQPYLSRALNLSERHLGETHPDLVILLNDLSRLYLKQSAFEFAEPLLLRLLALKRTKGEDHPEVATVLASLATVRQSLGRYDSAEQLWRRVLEIRERTLAPHHFSLATTLEHLAGTCAARGNTKEALDLFKRALSIRELTLGADHASLRASRERIADLELQASEDSFDGGVATPAVSSRPSAAPTERAVLPSAPPSTTRIPDPLPPSPRESQPWIDREVASAGSRPGARPAAPFEPVIPPPPQARPERAAQSARTNEHDQLEDPPYLKVLLEIKDELEQTDSMRRTAEYESLGPRFGGSMMTAATSFMQRRRAAVIVGIAVIALPLVAWAMAGVARSDEVPTPALPAAVVAPPVTDSIASTNITLQDAVAATRADSHKDSTAITSPAPKPPATRPRVEVAEPRRAASAASAASDTTEPESNWIPTLPPTTVVRLDSVVGAMSTTRLLAEAMPMPSAGAPVPARQIGDVETSAPQRARLIGSLPTPRYPAQLLLARIGGEVVVRFQVDTVGRPVMTTFAVVSSPDPGLTAAVRRVIPTMRFEPARSPGPEFRPVPDMMEIGFTFSPNRD